MWYPEITNTLTNNIPSATTVCDIFNAVGERNSTTGMNSTDSLDCLVHDKMYIDNLVMALGSFISNTITYFLCLKFNIRSITLGLMILSSATTFLLPGQSNEIMILIFFTVFVNSTATTLGTFTIILVDKFPTHLSGMAISLTMLIGRIGTFIGTNALGLFLQTNCQRTIYGTASMLIMGVICLIILPKRVIL